ncbi:MAG: MarR family winged helix-turn-helix transcriptional regulator [Alphaproteobacteria bacterium]
MPRNMRIASSTAPEPLRIEYQFSQQVGHLLRRAYQRHTAIFQRLCPDAQLTSVQFAVLCAVADQGACSLAEIGRAAAIDPATTRGIVERLQERKLIALSSDRDDKRKVIVALEPSGRQLVEDILPHAQEITRRTVRSLNPAEQVALNYLLQKLSEMTQEDFDAEA